MKAVSMATTSELDDLLTLSATYHHKICPLQVLGVRIGWAVSLAVPDRGDPGRDRQGAGKADAHAGASDVG